MEKSLVKSMHYNRICFCCHQTIDKNEEHWLVSLSSKGMMERLGMNPISYKTYRLIHVCLGCWTEFHPKLIAIEHEGYVPLTEEDDEIE